MNRFTLHLPPMPTYLCLLTNPFLATYLPTYQMARLNWNIIYSIGFTTRTKIWLLNKLHVHIHYIVMKSWMAFTTTNLVMGVVIFAMFWHNAFSSCGASSMMKQGFQLCMYDNVFAFKGFNHLSKSSTVH